MHKKIITCFLLFSLIVTSLAGANASGVASGGSGSGGAGGGRCLPFLPVEEKAELTAGTALISRYAVDDSGFNEVLQIKCYLSDGNAFVFDLSDRTKIDGIRYEVSDAEACFEGQVAFRYLAREGELLSVQFLHGRRYSEISSSDRAMKNFFVCYKVGEEYYPHLPSNNNLYDATVYGDVTVIESVSSKTELVPMLYYDLDSEWINGTTRFFVYPVYDTSLSESLSGTLDGNEAMEREADYLCFYNCESGYAALSFGVEGVTDWSSMTVFVNEYEEKVGYLADMAVSSSGFSTAVELLVYDSNGRHTLKTTERLWVDNRYISGSALVESGYVGMIRYVEEDGVVTGISKWSGGEEREVIYPSEEILDLPVWRIDDNDPYVLYPTQFMNGVSYTYVDYGDVYLITGSDCPNDVMGVISDYRVSTQNFFNDRKELYIEYEIIGAGTPFAALTNGDDIVRTEADEVNDYEICFYDLPNTTDEYEVLIGLKEGEEIIWSQTITASTEKHRIEPLLLFDYAENGFAAEFLLGERNGQTGIMYSASKYKVYENGRRVDEPVFTRNSMIEAIKDDNGDLSKINILSATESLTNLTPAQLAEYEILFYPENRSDPTDFPLLEGQTYDADIYDGKYAVITGIYGTEAGAINYMDIQTASYNKRFDVMIELDYTVAPSQLSVALEGYEPGYVDPYTICYFGLPYADYTLTVWADGELGETKIPINRPFRSRLGGTLHMVEEVADDSSEKKVAVINNGVYYLDEDVLMPWSETGTAAFSLFSASNISDLTEEEVLFTLGDGGVVSEIRYANELTVTAAEGETIFCTVTLPEDPTWLTDTVTPMIAVYNSDGVLVGFRALDEQESPDELVKNETITLPEGTDALSCKAQVLWMKNLDTMLPALSQ